MACSSNAQARKSPLSSRLHELLEALIVTIDARYKMLKDMESDSSEHYPETCPTCDGTGIILIPSLVETEVESDDDLVTVNVPSGSGASHSANPGAVTPAVAAPAVVANIDHVFVSAVTAATPSATPAVASTTATPAVVTTAATPAVVSTAATPAVVTTAATPAATPAVVSTAATPAVVTTAATPAVVATAATPGPSVTTASAATNPMPAVVQGNGLLPVSTPIPGLNPLPAGTPVPHPSEAVYADAGGPRYYTVTRGRRLGIFGGWQNTTPYVTGVGAACFSKFPTVYEAYEAYVVAYQRGLVMYL